MIFSPRRIVLIIPHFRANVKSFSFFFDIRLASDAVLHHLTHRITMRIHIGYRNFVCVHASVVSQASSLSLIYVRQMSCKIVRNFYAASFKVETLLPYLRVSRQLFCGELRHLIPGFSTTAPAACVQSCRIPFPQMSGWLTCHQFRVLCL